MNAGLTDVQNRIDERKIALKKAGIKQLHYPITVMDKMNKFQHTAASVDLAVNLPRHFKGTHMSRFVEVFNDYCKNITMQEYINMLESIRGKLDAACAYGEIRFPYFIEKEAPVTKQKGIMCYNCAFTGFVSENSVEKSFNVIVKVPIQTVCPCSKEISRYGAHNQRGEVTVKLKVGSFFWIEDLVDLTEGAASSAVYSLLKRADEKFVTEFSYENPKFVEDVVRDVCIALPKLGNFPYCEVEAENYESIHNHNAFASAEGKCENGAFLQTNW